MKQLDLIAKLQTALAGQSHRDPSVVMGFDGFVDRIARRVTGASAEGARRLNTMGAMGAMLSARGEHSFSIELSDMEERVGGNMPITASALGTLGVGVDCFGAFGGLGVRERGAAADRIADLDPVFRGMPAACRLHSYARPGHCLALEFDSCKLFLADNGEIEFADWAMVRNRVGEELARSLARARLIGLFNWGELAAMQGIWWQMALELPQAEPGAPRTLLVDPADCSRRTREELKGLLDTLALFRRHCTVALSVNEGEMRALADALDIEGEDALDLGRQMGAIADVLVLHTGRLAAAWAQGREAVLPTRYVDAPALLTGGGDCFNAGFALGLLAGCTEQECLACANTLSRCYVKNGDFPTWEVYMQELKDCNKWEVGQ